MPTARERRLKRENAVLRAQVADLSTKVDRLLGELARLTTVLEESQRAAKRQAAPFSKGEPKAEPKRPGRKPGHDYGEHSRRAPPPPESIDEVHQAALPDACPACGGTIQPSDVQRQYQIEIPRKPLTRRFEVSIGHCRQCGKRVQGRHPLQTSDALGAAASQLGPDAKAALCLLNKQAGLSHGKVAEVFADLFGIAIARSTCVRSVLGASTRLKPAYDRIGLFLRQGQDAALDETGWRVGGQKAWLHVAANRQAAYYGIRADRSGQFAEDLLGLDWDGRLTHDGWQTYQALIDAVHQQCLAHPMQRAKEILQVALGAAAGFPRQVLDLFKEALELKDRYLAGRASRKTLEAAADEYFERLVALARPRKTYEPNRKLAGHLLRHAHQWFLFLIDPAIEATNWLAEQAIRPAVVNRKVWGGNRTWMGANAQAILTSVIQTCRKQSQTVVDWLSHSLRAQSADLLPSIAIR